MCDGLGLVRVFDEEGTDTGGGGQHRRSDGPWQQAAAAPPRCRKTSIHRFGSDRPRFGPSGRFGDGLRARARCTGRPCEILRDRGGLRDRCLQRRCGIGAGSPFSTVGGLQLGKSSLSSRIVGDVRIPSVRAFLQALQFVWFLELGRPPRRVHAVIVPRAPSPGKGGARREGVAETGFSRRLLAGNVMVASAGRHPGVERSAGAGHEEDSVSPDESA